MTWRTDAHRSARMLGWLLVVLAVLAAGVLGWGIALATDWATGLAVTGICWLGVWLVALAEKAAQRRDEEGRR